MQFNEELVIKAFNGQTTKAAAQAIKQVLMDLIKQLGPQLGPLMHVVAQATVRNGLEVRFNGRLKRTLGRATSTREQDKAARLEIGVAAWPHLSPKHRFNIVVHELAHLLAECMPPHGWCVGGRGRQHDDVWRKLCLALGGDGQRVFDSAQMSDTCLAAIGTKAALRELRCRAQARKAAKTIDGLIRRVS